MITVSQNYDLIWTHSDHDEYQFTKDGKCFNVKRGKEVRRIINGRSIGFCIKGKFKSLSSIRTKLTKIEINTFPF